MADSPVSSVGIKVGDAVLAFIGDTTNLESAWKNMEATSKASATRTVNEVISQYDKLGIQGSAKLNRAAEQAAQSFQKLQQSGVASITDLIRAEQVMIEKTIALKQSLGESVPVAVLERLESLKVQYVGLTGTVAEFDAAQVASVARMTAVTDALDVNAAALRRNAAAAELDMAAAEADFAAQNELAASKLKVAADAKAAGLSLAAGGAEAGAAGGAGLGAGLGIAGTAGILAATAGLVAGAHAALDFEGAFAELTTIMDTKSPEGAAQVALIKEQLLALPPTLGSVTELTKAMYEALSAGIPAALSVEFVGKAAVFARGALTDVHTAVDLLTSIFINYGYTVKETDKVTAALFTTITEAKTRGPELAESLGRVIPIAASMKVSLNELLAAVGAMTHTGFDTAEAVTALRQALVSLEKPSTNAVKQFAEMQKGSGQAAKSFSDIRDEIQTKGLNVAMQDLANITKGNSELVVELFGNVRALTGVLSLTGSNAQKYASYLREIADASTKATAAQDAMDKILASQEGQLKTLSNAITNNFIIAWETLKPVTDGAAKSLYDIFVASGAAKVAGFALASTFTILGIALELTASVVNGLRSGVFGLALAFEEVQLKTHAYKGSVDDLRASMDSLRKSQVGADQDAKNNIAGIKQMSDAFDNLVNGQTAAKTSNQQFADAQRAKAVADQEGAVASKKAADALTDQARVIQEAKDKAKALEEQTKKTTKAMEAYANAHAIPLTEELEKGVGAARKFANELAASGAPTASQTAAIINLNIAMGKLRAMLDDKRTIGQTLFEIGSGGKAIQEIEQTTSDISTVLVDSVDRWSGIMSRVPVVVSSPVVDAFNLILEAEQRLGIAGTATLSKHAIDAEQAFQVLKESGSATANDLRLASEEVARANLALADSFQTDTQLAMADALKAEQALGIQGTAYLTAHRNAAKEAFDAVKAGAAKGVESVVAVEEAELAFLKADIALKTQLGQPIPATTLTSYRNLSNALDVVHQKGAQALASQKSFYEFIKTRIPETANTIGLLKNVGASAFDSFAGAFGNMVSAVVSGQKSIGEAIKEAVAQTLTSIASQAAVYALYNTAEGFAALANPLTAYQAPAYFTAAAEYAGVAVIAGVAGAALSGGGNASGAGSSSGSGSSVSASAPGQVNPVNVQNVQRFGSGALVTGRTLAMIGDSRHSANVDATEAVLPLEDPKAMAMIAGAIVAASGGSGLSGGVRDVYVQGLVSPDNLSKVIDQINSQVQGGKKLNATTANRVTKKS